MRGRWWAVIAALVAAGSLSLSAPQHRVAGLRGPAGGGHRVLGRARRCDDHGAARLRRPPRCGGWSIAWASSAGSEPSRSVVFASSTSAVLPTRITCAPPAFARAGGAELVERGLRGVRHVLAVGEQHGRAQRPAHQLGGGDRRAPVLRVDERDDGGPGVARARGVDRLGDARGVGDRVGTAHARGVLRGETGEAEALARFLVVAALADDGLLLSCRRRRRRRRRSPRARRTSRTSRRRIGRGTRPWTR